MPPEMITIVAPTAMIAKKLASVAVWISVYEFRKLLTGAPVTRSGWLPANSVRTRPSSRMTSTRPAAGRPGAVAGGRSTRLLTTLPREVAAE
jgi:hypothetical protein